MKYENSPPPSDFEYDDIRVVFAFPRPQNVFIRGYFSVDYNLIHPKLRCIKNEDSSNIIKNDTNENGKQDVHKDINENFNEKVMHLNVTENEKLNFMTVTDRITDNTSKNKKKKKKKAKISSKVENKSADVLQHEEHISDRKQRRKCHRHHQSKRVISSVDSDESDINSTNAETSRYKLISKSYSKKSNSILKDSDRKKPKLHKHSKMCKDKKRNSVFEDDHSRIDSDKSKMVDYCSKKSKRSRCISSDGHSVHKYNIPTRDISCDSSHPKSPEVKVKQEFFSDDEISYLEKHEGLESDENSKRSIPKREVKQEIKPESMDSKESKEFHGPDTYYCFVCKLSLNSELTWQSHLLGQRHAKAIRAQSVLEVAKSSLLSNTHVPVFEEGYLHDKPPDGMERVELKKSVASIQEVCDDLQHRQLIIGLSHVWEIRGETETTYYCNLCDAPCGASSVMLHLIGFKHRLQCLKKYFPQHYDRYKDNHKKKIESIMRDKFLGYEKLFRREKIRVFKDVPINDFKRSNSYSHGDPGPSWQAIPFSQAKHGTSIIKSEKGKPLMPSNTEFLDTKYADFHCTICDSHMNNISMWEAHIRGKRHLKNMKKNPEGVATSNKYIPAPPGTQSDLVKQIEEVCCSSDIIVGLNYIRENQGNHGNQYNCFPCGGCCSDIDIIDHLLSMKHKIKYLEKLHVDGFKNSIMEINSIQVSNYYREQMVNQECQEMVERYGLGKPKIYYLKRDLNFWSF